MSARELGSALRRLAGGVLTGPDGRPGALGVVRVLDRHGFGTVEPAQLLAAAPDGQRAGVLLGGTLDDVAVPLGVRAATEGPGTADGHVAEDPAVAAGLACAGGARLLGHPLPAGAADALGAALANGVPAALATPADGGRVLVLAGAELTAAYGTLGGAAADAAVTEAAAGRLRRGASVTEHVEADGLDVLLDLWVPVPTVLVVGSGAIGDALLAQAALLGWTGRRETGLDEARAATARFGDADVLVLLDHAGAFDDLLVDALRAGRGFVGALGSRRTQAGRRERLLAAGLTERDLAGLHGPVGLDLGARTPGETAVSIVAEVLAVRSGRTPSGLAATAGRIGS